ncbi:MAG TPA: choice-of-anchor tandem repeat GloVer-containing protein [Candidatus Sulfotelmatobacter sp.]|nr:choice-of-anchor tandem repeat GloVer-containing protein [Candidatus Sulfotelmatobacter sp.]
MKKSLCAKTLYFVCAICVAAAIPSDAQTFTSLVKLNGANGEGPSYGSMIQGLDGNFYGTTTFGGANNGGEVFKITPSGQVTTIYSFCQGAGCPDGSVPSDSLLQGFDGNLYGTTSEGGMSNDGTIFKLTRSGVLTTLHQFCSEANCADGAVPVFGLIQGINGNFYGTTTPEVAGISGTVFEITRTGQLTTLYTFCALSNCLDGAGPGGALMLATDGNYYGATGTGGSQKAGTIFRVTAGGKLTTIHSFNKSDGALPNSLIQAADGSFYGTTEYGGLNNKGVIFKLSRSGQFSVLHNFCSVMNCVDGASSHAPLVEGTDGNLYGTTTFGGVDKINGQLFGGYGTVFRISPTGQFTVLHTFCTLGGTCADGAYPLDGLTQGTDGNFYGTTYGLSLCPGNCGTVFKLSMGLAPFIEASPTFGRVGHAVHILGNNLLGATSVTFNGVPATFKVGANSFITATVPSGASSGKIEVTTPGGTLLSNRVFEVIP